MDTSTFPKKIKEAHVRPLLKKTYLPKLTENYRPVSYLSFISKILENVVADWLQAHIKKISVYLITITISLQETSFYRTSSTESTKLYHY